MLKSFWKDAIRVNKDDFGFLLHISETKKKPRAIEALGFPGPSGETWTHDPLTPSQVRYQLRYTRISLMFTLIEVSLYILTRVL